MPAPGGECEGGVRTDDSGNPGSSHRPPHGVAEMSEEEGLRHRHPSGCVRWCSGGKEFWMSSPPDWAPSSQGHSKNQ